MKQASGATKKYIEILISAISEAITPFGPGITVVIAEDITANAISLVVFEMPTELLYGPMDGSEIFYGFSFDVSPIETAVNIEKTLFTNDENGVSITLTGKSIASPIRTIEIKIQDDPSDNIQAAQTFNNKNSSFSPRELPANVIAIIKGG